jgi:uncharacterized protein YjbI with pentapeptide repeats
VLATGGDLLAEPRNPMLDDELGGPHLHRPRHRTAIMPKPPTRPHPVHKRGRQRPVDRGRVRLSNGLGRRSLRSEDCGRMRRLDALRDWRERWKQPEARAAARQIASELQVGRLRTVSPFGRVEGRVDLRGLQVDLLAATHDAMRERVTARDGQWSALDLTGAGLSGMNWFNLQVADCVLDDAQLDDLRCWGVEVSDCSAHRASLRSAQIGSTVGAYRRSRWHRIEMPGADVRYLVGDVELIDVDLSRANFSATDLGRSDLIRVRFAGRVDNLTIAARRVEGRAGSWALSDVDFSGADPIGLQLLGVDYGTPAVDVPSR